MNTPERELQQHVLNFMADRVRKDILTQVTLFLDGNYPPDSGLSFDEFLTVTAMEYYETALKAFTLQLIDHLIVNNVSDK